MNKDKYLIPLSIFLAAVIAGIGLIYHLGVEKRGGPQPALSETSGGGLEEMILPAEGVVLPIRWGNLGRKMVEAGVIDKDKFESLYAERGGLNEEEYRLLYGDQNGNLKITRRNSAYLLNLLWAFGLANKNPILENGPMTDSRYGGANRFASTGGWTLARGNAMDYYSRYVWVTLTPDEQAKVERVSRGIYRPCCDNQTYFPDCNHGMAMLGLLELMTSQGLSEEEMYRYALTVNAYWFPDTYLTIGKYLQERGESWAAADPKQILGKDFSSASGFYKILSQTTPYQSGSGAGCGV